MRKISRHTPKQIYHIKLKSWWDHLNLLRNSVTPCEIWASLVEHKADIHARILTYSLVWMAKGGYTSVLYDLLPSNGRSFNGSACCYMSLAWLDKTLQFFNSHMSFRQMKLGRIIFQSTMVGDHWPTSALLMHFYSSRSNTVSPVYSPSCRLYLGILTYVICWKKKSQFLFSPPDPFEV